MFGVTNVPVMVRKLQIEFEEDDDGEKRRLCSLRFRLPLLSFERAADMTVPVRRFCFDNEERPRWDVNDVHFTPPEGKYMVTLKAAPDLVEPSAVLHLAVIDTIRVWRPKDKHRDLALEFVTQHELTRGDAKDLSEILAVCEAGSSYITFNEVQLSLDLDAATDQGRDERRPH